MPTIPFQKGSLMQTWHEAIGSEKSEPYFQHIIETVKKERGMGRIIYPPAEDVFNAFRATEFGKRQSRDFGARPVSWRRTGARAGVFRPRRHHRSAFAGQYLQRIGGRHRRFPNPATRLSATLGGTGRFTAQYRPDRPRWTGAFPCHFGLGTLYRRSRQPNQPKPRTRRLHALG